MLIVALFTLTLSIITTVVHFHPGWFALLQRSFTGAERLLRLFRLGYLVAASASLVAVSALLTDATGAEVLTVASLAGLLILDIGEMLIISRRRIPAQAVSTPQSILFVAAHPDDIEIAAGGTVAKLVDRGHQVHAIIMCDGAQGGDASLRPDEARGGAQFLGMSSLTIHDLPDRMLEKHIQQMVAHIEEAIVAYNPDVIFTHSHNEIHQDHAAVHTAVLRAGRNHHSILCFESPSVTSDFKPTVFFDTTDYRDVKFKAVTAHANQMGKPYMSRDTIDGITAFRGRQARVPRAEAFEVVRLQVNNVLPI